MGWFANTFKRNRVTPVVESEQTRARNAKYKAAQEWLAGLSSSDLEGMLDELWAEFNETRSLAFISEDADAEQQAHDEKLQPLFEIFRAECLKVDRSHVTGFDAYTMQRILLRQAPSVAGSYKRTATNLGIIKALFGEPVGSSGVAVASQGELVAQMKGLIAGVGVLAQVKELISGIGSVKHGQWFNEYAAGVSRTSLVIPNLNVQEFELQTAIGRMNDLWVQANALPLGEADRFFVDEVAARYFPDAWSLFKSFRDGDADMLVSARRSFLEQVDLLGQRLKRLIDASQTTALAQVEAQTSFLREVTAV